MKTKATKSYSRKDTMCLTEDVLVISTGICLHLHRPYKNITTQRPKVRLLHAVHPFQLIHLGDSGVCDGVERL